MNQSKPYFYISGNSYKTDLRQCVLDTMVIDTLRYYHKLTDEFVKISLIDLTLKDRDFKEGVYEFIGECFKLSHLFFSCLKSIEKKEKDAESKFLNAKKEADAFIFDSEFILFKKSVDYIYAEKMADIYHSKLIDCNRSAMFDEYGFIFSAMQNVHSMIQYDEIKYIDEIYKCYSYVLNAPSAQK